MIADAANSTAPTDPADEHLSRQPLPDEAPVEDFDCGNPDCWQCSPPKSDDDLRREGYAQALTDLAGELTDLADGLEDDAAATTGIRWAARIIEDRRARS